MRLPLLSGVVFAILCGAAGAQEQPAMHAPDGSTRERPESLVILPKTNAPFSATVTTEWTRILVDSTSQTNWNHRTIARDSSGRVFEERRYFTPTGNQETTMLTERDYRDPNRRERYICMTAQRVCFVSPFSAPESVNLMPAGNLPGGRGTVTREELGRKTIEDIEVIGSRESITLNAGSVGNEKAEPIVKEFWYSPRLGINVITKRFDPRFGVQNFTVSNINQSEPDPKLFEPPADYRVVMMNGQ